MRSALKSIKRSKLLRKCLGRPYLLTNIWIWNHLPATFSSWRLGWYGAHLHRLIQLRSRRTQNVGTFFFRNRPEIELLIRLLRLTPGGSNLEMAILGCSKGAEVYSFAHSIRSARPDLSLRLHALDIDPDVLEFAREGTYSVDSNPPAQTVGADVVPVREDLAARTFRGQLRWVLERMSPEEIEAVFERAGGVVNVKRRVREGVTWHLGDASDPRLIEMLGVQDIVVANRFLCHMQPEAAEACLHNLARLVKAGGYLFVSGVDLNVRTKVARELGWTPVTDLIREIHEGDPSLRKDWPLEYWGLEPFDRRRNDWDIRYASVFQLGVAFPATIPDEPLCENASEVLAHRHH
jgi:chemotaxis methyl-accepting protein methylase